MISESKSLKDIYVDHLNNLYSAENKITATLPNLIKFVNSPFLKKDLEYQLQETENRIKRLDRIFELLEKNWNEYKNGKTGNCSQTGKLDVVGKNISPDQIEALFTSRGQYGETSQDSSPYGTARFIAELLGEKEAVELISQTLEDGKGTNVSLTEIGMIVVQIGAL